MIRIHKMKKNEFKLDKIKKTNEKEKRKEKETNKQNKDRGEK